MVCIDI
jgi:WD40 repeat protein